MPCGNDHAFYFFIPPNAYLTRFQYIFYLAHADIIGQETLNK